uniref:Zinc finger, CCHC-type n=1 Tax=Tanacetum cinerariifolium TaxID=118510 RepID=A0A6L2JUF7_TANCI|nr:zinc finger, CCHC-type [Tanacetum cinerariifolium]
MGDVNQPRTLGDYSQPIHEGYQNTIELPEGDNVLPLRSDTIRLVQNECAFHELWSEDPNQHLKDFLKLMDSLDFNEEEWDDLIFPEKGSLNYENANMEQRLENMEYQVDSLIKDAISLVGKSENLCGIMRNEGGYLSLELPHQEAVEGLVVNLILDEEEKGSVVKRMYENDMSKMSRTSKSIRGQSSSSQETIEEKNALTVRNEAMVLLFWPSIRDGEFRAKNMVARLIRDPRIFWYFDPDVDWSFEFEPSSQIFKKKSLVAMDILMEEEEEEVNKDGTKSSVDTYRGMSRRDWQAYQVGWIDQHDGL